MWPLPQETIGQTRPQRKANRTSTSSTTKRYGKGARPLSYTRYRIGRRIRQLKNSRYATRYRSLSSHHSHIHSRHSNCLPVSKSISLFPGWKSSSLVQCGRFCLRPSAKTDSSFFLSWTVLFYSLLPLPCF